MKTLLTLLFFTIVDYLHTTTTDLYIESATIVVTPTTFR